MRKKIRIKENTSMNSRLLIRDLTLRDGQQSLFATRMRQEQIDRVLPYYKEANFYAMEVWGGAVPDSVMRYLGENPWVRLEKIKAQVGDVSKLTALSRGRNLFGYSPYTNEIIDGFCRNAIESGLGIMRIFDALNDLNNVKSTIKYVKQHGGMADCAVCYTTDPSYTWMERFTSKLKGNPLPNPVFTDQYFLNKALELERLGADIVTIKDMSGLIPPMRVAKLISAFKKNLKIPVDFHTHCTPGYGLAAVLAAIVNGVDIVDANIWNFSGGPAAPAIELIYVFCKKLGIKLDVNMEAVAEINKELMVIRRELADVDASKQFPNAFNPLTDTLPAEIDKKFDDAIAAAKANKEVALLEACHAIEDYFNFPKPNELVKTAQVPGGMYTNMVAQLKALGAESILEDAMKLIPEVRLAAGLPPLVTPTSQIVGAQAVNCAQSIKSGSPMYSNVSVQFVSLVKGEYGDTPIPIDPAFREQITGSKQEIAYDTSKYKMQPNPELADAGGVKLAETEKEVLLLELFPMVAKNFLAKSKKAKYQAENVSKTKADVVEAPKEVKKSAPKILGKKVIFPMPGRIIEICVKQGDKIEKGQKIAVLEAMKMENVITSEFSGYVNSILAEEGETLAANAVIMDVVDSQDKIVIETAPVVEQKPVVKKVEEVKAATVEAPKAKKNVEISGTPVKSPMPGRVIAILVKEGDTIVKGQPIVMLEAMKMENSINAEFAGVVKNIFVEEEQTVAAEEKLITVEKQ